MPIDAAMTTMTTHTHTQMSPHVSPLIDYQQQVPPPLLLPLQQPPCLSAVDRENVRSQSSTHPTHATSYWSIIEKYKISAGPLLSLLAVPLAVVVMANDQETKMLHVLLSLARQTGA